MKRNLIRSFLVSGVLATISVVTVVAQTQSAGSKLSPEHEKVLNAWIKTAKLNLRPALMTDFVDANALSQARAEWGSDYYPYYRVGDFNRDGKDDFAVVLIDPTSKKKTRFSIAVFHGGGGE